MKKTIGYRCCCHGTLGDVWFTDLGGNGNVIAYRRGAAGAALY